ncbi:MAG: TlpA disulfide reductase family protein, partial [Pontibacterium sp.]
MRRHFILILLLCFASVSSHAGNIFEQEFASLEDKPMSLNQYQGKVLVVNFWATWCPPCIDEMPSLQRLHQYFKDKKDESFQVVAISAGE